MLRKAAAILIVFVFTAVWVLCPAEAAVNQTLDGRVVILDAGHGFESTNSYADYDEQVTMLKLAQKLAPILESRGAEVYQVRPTQTDIVLPARAAIINKYALTALKDARLQELSSLSADDYTLRLENEIAEIDRLIGITQSVIDDPETNAPIYLNSPFDYTYTRKIHPDWQAIFEYEDDPLIRDRFLVVSLHSNATGKPIDESQNGVDAFYISNDLEKNETYYSDYSNEQRSLYFGELIVDGVSMLGLEKREVSPYYYLMIREHNLPCVLVENGFHTNERDRTLLSNDLFLDRLAMTYADAISYYFASFESDPETSQYLDDVFGSRD